MTMAKGVKRLAWGLLTACLLGSVPAGAAYFTKPQSDIDPSIFEIDEVKYLGAKADGDIRLVDGEGRAFTLGEMLGQPLILVLSYYTCDGSCSVINENLRDLLTEAAGRVGIGEDFRVLTVSFDRHDDLKTMGAFHTHMKVSESLGPKAAAGGWIFATVENPDDIERLTKPFGYKYFWSPEDRTFFHPGVFMALTAEGRLARVLYALDAEPKDVELAVLDAYQGNFQPTVKDIINFAASLCYSYNYKEGSYTLNIPLFVAAGSLGLGVVAFSVSAVVFRRRRKRETHA